MFLCATSLVCHAWAGPSRRLLYSKVAMVGDWQDSKVLAYFADLEIEQSAIIEEIQVLRPRLESMNTIAEVVKNLKYLHVFEISPPSMSPFFTRLLRPVSAPSSFVPSAPS